MKVKIVFDVDDGTRRDINNYHSREGRSVKAPYAEVKSFIENHTSALFESIAGDDDTSTLLPSGASSRKLWWEGEE